MKFFKYLKTKAKYLFGIAALAAILSQLILPALSVKATNPRFNFLDGDYELIRGANVTNNESVWTNPISGESGDIFRGIVYYHNGEENTVAENTKIKVNLPSHTTNSSAVITASISADNAETVTNTVVEGQIVGLNGLNINLDQDADLEFISNSVRWFPDSNQNGGANQTPVNLPNGQTGDEIVSENGVNIGNIHGCWDYAGFITFDFRTKTKVTPISNLNIDKTVKNVSVGESDYAKQTDAQTGQIVEFSVTPSNTGEADLVETILSDNLPTGFEYVSSTFVKDGILLSDSDAAKFFDGGLNIGTIQAGKSGGTYTFQAKVVAENCDKLVNTATVSANSLTASSSATVNLVKANIVKSKSAYNDTKKAAAGTVDQGDLVTYTLTTSNTGSVAVDYTVSDNISDVLKNADIVSISDSGSVSNGIISWPAVNICAGQSVVRTFQVKIKSTVSNVCFVNTYGNSVQLCVPAKVVSPSLHIDKLVRDVTTNEENFSKSNQAKAGDTLEYIINYSNTGDGAADKVVFSDVLPANTEYIAGTTVISWNGGAEQTLSDGIVGGGVTIPTIEVGETGYIKLRVKIAAGIAADQVLTNTANLTYSGSTISSTAKTTIISKVVAAAATLPKSGGAAGASFLLTFISGIGLLYVKYRKMMASENVAIINQLLSA